MYYITKLVLKQVVRRCQLNPLKWTAAIFKSNGYVFQENVYQNSMGLGLSQSTEIKVLAGAIGLMIYNALWHPFATWELTSDYDTNKSWS